MDTRLFDYEIQFGGFDKLMPSRVREILMVASPYDAFIIAEDDRLTEIIFSEYLDLNLRYAPRVTRVTTGAEAIQHLRSERFDLIITMARVGKMDIAAFAKSAKRIAPKVPIALLTYSMLDVQRLTDEDRVHIDRIYLWTGDVKILMTIIKQVEDMLNIDRDIQTAEVQTIILVENSVQYYSYYLPILYTELMSQTQRLIAEGVNLTHKLMRMRARPKILLATDYEQALAYYEKYRSHVLAVVTDIHFPSKTAGEEAGLELIKRVKTEGWDTPVLFQSSDGALRERVEAMGASFLNKDSQLLAHEIRRFLTEHCGFGSFVFRMPDGAAVGRVQDLHEMMRYLGEVPEESLLFHANRNHFSIWLMARTEFELAYSMRPRRATEFQDAGALRKFLVETISKFLIKTEMGTVSEFSGRYFSEESPFAKIGGGSLGGKGRGLAFLSQFLSRHDLSELWEGVRIRIPNSVVVAADVFDAFMERNNLYAFVRQQPADDAVQEAFLRSKLPPAVRRSLKTFVEKTHCPLAVRSSSLLEDSAVRPFAGIYETYMLPNNHPDPKVRLAQLSRAIRLVYASAFLRRARTYLGSTAHLQQQEKMAVILQHLVGKRCGDLFYPHFAGVAQSYNYYPLGDIRPEDGIAHVALGLGETIVQGRLSLSFSPAHPQSLFQFSSTKDYLKNSQREFLALELGGGERQPSAGHAANLKAEGLERAEADGMLGPVGSTYSPADDRVYDGIHRKGYRLVTFANVLKADLFPLAPILRRICEVGEQALGCPVELEFAVDLDEGSFNILQMRPMMSWSQSKNVEVELSKRGRMLCYSPKALGHGRLAEVRDILYVKPMAFDTTKTRIIARQIGEVNQRLEEEGRRFVLIGPGRWGSADPCLGIPVQWEDISSVGLIVETTLPDFVVTPSYGTHFLHNVVSLEIGYLTVRQETEEGFIDWDWLRAQEVLEETDYLRHIRLPSPMEIRVDGRRGHGAAFKP